MTWQFYGGTTDPDKRTRESILFFFCMDPDKLLTMMDGLDDLTDEQRADLERGIRTMKSNKRGVLIGPVRPISDEAMREIEAWGTPAFLMVPTGFHTLDLLPFKQRYPLLHVVCGEGFRGRTLGLAVSP